MIALLPFKLLYVFSSVIAFILRDILGYRKETIKTNIKNSFPNISQKRINSIANSYYLNLSDIILESIKSYFLSAEELFSKRFVFTNINFIHNLIDNNNGVVLLTSHYNNWEWGVNIVNKALNRNCIGFYKPLSNKLIDNYIYKKRTRYGTKAYPMQQAYRIIAKEKNNKPIIILIADQSPSNLNNVEWVDFLNQKTAFLVGSEKIALKYNFPVVYLDINRVERGFYQAEFKMLIKTPSSYNQGEITKAYANHLEKIITENPTPWLWSHRRWKHKI